MVSLCTTRFSILVLVLLASFGEPIRAKETCLQLEPENYCGCIEPDMRDAGCGDSVIDALERRCHNGLKRHSHIEKLAKKWAMVLNGSKMNEGCLKKAEFYIKTIMKFIQQQNI